MYAKFSYEEKNLINPLTLYNLCLAKKSRGKSHTKKNISSPHSQHWTLKKNRIYTVTLGINLSFTNKLSKYTFSVTDTRIVRASEERIFTDSMTERGDVRTTRRSASDWPGAWLNQKRGKRRRKTREIHHRHNVFAPLRIRFSEFR